MSLGEGVRTVPLSFKVTVKLVHFKAEKVNKAQEGLKLILLVSEVSS